MTEPELAPSPGRRRMFYLVAIAFMAGLFELGSFAVTTFLTRQGWMAHIPDFTAEAMNAYLQTSDPVLGWAYSTDSTWGRATDSLGRITHPVSRRVPRGAAAAAPCVSAYGDSFVYGSEVDDSAAYPHLLSEVLGCPVRNFGVPGYGSDQAVMLFQAQAALDSAPVVLFQHLSENILRNVNQYANLLYPGGMPRFKPRFIIAGDSLTYVGPPVRSAEDFARVHSNPDSALRHDALLRRPRASLPYTLSLLKWLATDLKVRARLTGVPTEGPFYEPRHADGGLGLTATVLGAAVEQTVARGRSAVVVLQPTRQALIHARETGQWIDQPLHDALRAKGFRVLHTGPELLAASQPAGPCALFDGCTRTHLNPEGNRVVARTIASYLEAAGLAPGSAKTDSARVERTLPGKGP